MTYYLIIDAATQWFHHLVSKQEDKLIDVLDMSPLNGVHSTLLSNIYGRETVNQGTLDDSFVFRDSRLVNGGGHYGGWSISKLEFDRIKRLLELSPAVKEFNQVKDSI